MSFAVFQQLTESTAINASCLLSCSFTGAQATNLVVVKGERLEVYELQASKQQSRLVFHCAAPLFGRPDAVRSFRPRADAPEHLALAFHGGRYLAVLKYDAEFGAVRTCGQRLLVAPSDPASTSTPSAFRPIVAVDPKSKCLAVQVLLDRVVVFPVCDGATWQYDAGSAATPGGVAAHKDPDHPPGLSTPFSFSASKLHLHHLEDLVFLYGYQEPTAACLGQATPGWGGCLTSGSQANSSIYIVVLDLVEKVPHVVWTSHHLPHDLWQLVPLRPPVVGMLALGNNAVLYVKEHGSMFCQTLNASVSLGQEYSRSSMVVKDETKLQISLMSCAVVALDPTVLLFSTQPGGRLYLAHLVLGTRDGVSDIIWTTAGLAAPSRALCTVGDEHVLLVAAAGNSQLLRIAAAKKKLPSHLAPPKKRARVEALTVKEAKEEDEAKKEEAEDVKQEQLAEEKKPAAAPASDSKPASELDALLELHGTLRNAARSIRSFTGFVVADELQSFGPIECLQPWGQPSEEDGEEGRPDAGGAKFVCCSGSGSKGALYIMQRALPLETLADFDVAPDCSAVWSVRQPPEQPLIVKTGKRPATDMAGADDEGSAVALAVKAAEEETAPHRYVVVSGASRTMVLETTAEIEEISPVTPLDVTAATICAGSLCSEALLVQVTARQMRFMSTREPRRRDGLLPPPLLFASAPQPGAASTAPACDARVCDPYVAVRFQDHKLRVFRVQESAAGAPELHEISEKLPASFARVVCCSLFRDAARVLLVVVTPAARGGLRILQLSTFTEVFHAAHLEDVPPILRSGAGSKEEDSGELDHLRALTDLCAPLPKGAAAEAQAKADGPGGGADVIAAELVSVDADDRGPTLVVLLVGRPVLIYRAFLPPGRQEAAFPYSLRLVDHPFLAPLESKPQGPYRPVTAFRHPQSPLAGVFVVPPGGVSALCLLASHNRLFVHPMPGGQMFRGVAPLHAACCSRGFFAVAHSAGAVLAQVLTMSALEGLSEGSGSYELRAPMPHVRIPLRQNPRRLATRPADDALALVVSELVLEQPKPADAQPEDDPLSDDWSIVREPPVEVEPPPVPRLQSRHELWIDKASDDLSKLGKYHFSFDPDEHVLSMMWVTLPSFPSPSLAVGTGVITGEDLTCRGRLMIFSTRDRDPGILPAMYQRALKWPVTVVGQWGSYFLHSEGHKLYFERWENNSFNKLAFIDGGMCITSLSSIKNFLLLGDLRKGIDFAQWKEDSAAQTRNLRRLSRSAPSVMMTVLACDFIIHGSSLGLVALDHTGSAHLYQYSPHSDGREGDQLLRSCASFAMGSPCRAMLRLQGEASVQSLMLASAAGDFLWLKPIDDQAYRTATTLLGMLATRLPFRCGLNPRAFRHHDGRVALVAPRKNIEDTTLLRLFAFLSSPLQKLIADKMRLGNRVLAKSMAQLCEEPRGHWLT